MFISFFRNLILFIGMNYIAIFVNSSLSYYFKYMSKHYYAFILSEAVMRIVNNPEKYIKALSDGNYSISGVVGKGGKIYHDKIMKHKDRELIQNMKNIPSKQTFNRDLKQIDINLRAHDFRYQYARNLFEKKVSEVGYDMALLEVSKALNHNRSEISNFN